MTAASRRVARRGGAAAVAAFPLQSRTRSRSRDRTWYEDIEEALSLPGDQDAVWLAGVFVPGNPAAGLFVPGDTAARLLRRYGSLQWVHYSGTGVEHMPSGTVPRERSRAHERGRSLRTSRSPSTS